MRNVVFVAPFPLETTLQFCRALAGLQGVRLLGLFQQPPRGEAAEIFHDVLVVRDALGRAGIASGVAELARRHGAVHRLLGVLEDLQEELAAVRQQIGIDGPTPQVADVFRDKGRMKDALRAAGLPCARHARIASARDAWDFVQQVGFPVVLKPPAGAGSRSTFRVDSLEDLDRALAALRPTPDREVLGEEFLTGQEFSFETLTLGGRPVFHSIGRYYPGPLEVVRNDWVQWIVHLPRDISGPEFDAVRDVGAKAIAALGLVDGMTHMEWFRRPDGSIAIGEIAARPPGAQIVRLMSTSHDADLYQAWGRAVVDGAWDGPWERRWSSGVAFLRGQGRGRITAVDGLDDAQARMGHLVTAARLPQVGAHRSSSYEGEGWALVRHEDDQVVLDALLDLVRTVRVRYEA